MLSFAWSAVRRAWRDLVLAYRRHQRVRELATHRPRDPYCTCSDCVVVRHMARHKPGRDYNRNRGRLGRR